MLMNNETTGTSTLSQGLLYLKMQKIKQLLNSKMFIVVKSNKITTAKTRFQHFKIVDLVENTFSCLF